MFRLSTLGFALALLLSGLPGTGLAAPNYSIRDIGALAGAGADSSAYGVAYIPQNQNNGTLYVVGSYQITDSSPLQAFVYSIKTQNIGNSSLSGSFQTISLPGSNPFFTSSSMLAMAVSSNGLITGVVGDSSAANPFDAGNYRAFASSVGSPTTTAVVPSTAGTQGFGINSSGTVVGQMDSGSTQHAFSATGGTATDLGHGGTSYAQGISNSGQIVGQDTWGSVHKATLWSGGTETNLGSGSSDPSIAKGINQNGQIVGYDMRGGTSQALLWQMSGGSWVQSDINLSSLSAQGSRAFGINSAGLVVGEYDTASSTNAFLYDSATSQAYDLKTLADTFHNPSFPDLFSELTSAASISEQIPGILNAIVGVGLVGGVEHAFLAWDPLADVSNGAVPEPGTMALLCLGLAAAFLFGKKGVL